MIWAHLGPLSRPAEHGLCFWSYLYGGETKATAEVHNTPGYLSYVGSVTKV